MLTRSFRRLSGERLLSCFGRGAVDRVQQNPFHFLVYCRRCYKLEVLFSILRGKIRRSGTDEFAIKVKKSELIFFKKKLNDPLRSVSGDEASFRLLVYLVLESTNVFQRYAENLYLHAQDRYVHDMRAGAGKLQQFANYISGKYPGRLPGNGVGSKEKPLCFPNPELLRGNFYFSERDCCYVLDMRSLASGPQILLVEAVRMRLGRIRRQRGLSAAFTAEQCLEEFLEYLDYGGGRIVRVPCEEFLFVMKELIFDPVVRSYIRNELYLRQKECFISRLKRDFDQLKFTTLGLQAHAVPSDSSSVASESIAAESENIVRVRRAISALKKVRLLIVNPFFFQRCNNGLGVLQAQQYFRGLDATILCMVSFLAEYRRVGLTELELQLFLKKVCGDTVRDISHLLVIHDFLATGEVVDRDAVLRIASAEIKEISEEISRWTSLFNRIVQALEQSDTSVSSCPQHTHTILRFRLESQFDTLVRKGSLDEGLRILFNGMDRAFSKVDDRWVVDVAIRNHLLFEYLKFHPLCEFWNGFRYIHDEGSEKVFEALFAPEFSSKEVLALLRYVVEKGQHDWIKDVKRSRVLGFSRRMHKVSRFLPFNSLWLPYVNPGRYRTTTGCKGYRTKSKFIPFTQFSKSISDGLCMENFEHRFVRDNHEARMLASSFRMEHNIPGFRERSLFVLKKNKFVLYVTLALLGVLCSVIAIVGVVLDHFGIIPGALLRGFLHVLRAIFDTTFAIVGLDTVTDKIVLLILNVSGIVVRVLDFILLCGLVSRVTRFLFSNFYKACNFVFDSVVQALKKIAAYGFKDSCFLLLESLCKGARSFGDSLRVKLSNVRAFFRSVCTRGSTQRSRAQSFEYDSSEEELIAAEHTPELSALGDVPGIVRTADLGVLLEEVYHSNGGNISAALKSVSHIVGEELYGQKLDVSHVLNNFQKTLGSAYRTAFSGFGRDYARLREEFFLLLNSYAEFLSISEDEPNCPTVLNSYKMRRAVYDKITAINLQTSYLANRRVSSSSGTEVQVINIHSDEDVLNILEAAHSIGQPIDMKELNQKIAALRWALDQFVANDIGYLIRDWETVFRDTKIERSCVVALMDCILILQDYRSRLHRNQRVGRGVVNCCIRSNFRPYLRDVCCILRAVDRSSVIRHCGDSYRKFCEIVGENFLLLEYPSPAATKVSEFIGLSLGSTPCHSRLQRELVEFLEYFQDLKLLLLSMALHQAVVLGGGSSVVSNYEYCSQFSDAFLSAMGADGVYDLFMSTPLGEQFLLFFWGSVFPKDVALVFKEFCEAVVLVNEEDEAPFSCHIDQRAYLKSFLYRGYAIEEVRSFVDSLGDLVCTVLPIHLSRRILRSMRKVQVEDIRYFILREEESYPLGPEGSDEEVSEDESALEESSSVCDPMEEQDLRYATLPACSSGKTVMGKKEKGGASIVVLEELFSSDTVESAISRGKLNPTCADVSTHISSNSIAQCPKVSKSPSEQRM